jgi:hypothetical protein
VLVRHAEVVSSYDEPEESRQRPSVSFTLSIAVWMKLFLGSSVTRSILQHRAFFPVKHDLPKSGFSLSPSTLTSVGTLLDNMTSSRSDGQLPAQKGLVPTQEHVELAEGELAAFSLTKPNVAIIKKVTTVKVTGFMMVV